MQDIVLPSLAEGVSKATVSFWHRRVGDRVKTGDDLVELATDKATFNMPSPAEGVIREIRAQEGDDKKLHGLLHMSPRPYAIIDIG